MAKAYRIIEIGVSRWQWKVLQASAKAWRDKDVEAHASVLLYESIVQIAKEPVGEFEEPFPVPSLSSWRWEWSFVKSCYQWTVKGTGFGKDAFRWHPRRWWRSGK